MDAVSDALRLGTRIVGAKFYKERKNLPKDAEDKKINICQLIAAARYQGTQSSGVPDRMVCAIGAAAVGLIRTPARYTNGEANYRLTANQDAGQRLWANTYKIGDRGKIYDGVYLAPLAGFSDSSPDLVIIYGNPAQIMRLIHCCLYDSGEQVKGDTTAEAAVCSCMGYALDKRRPVIGLPCVGDRMYGGTQNDELVFVVPYDRYEKIVANLEALLSEYGPLYPIPPYTGCSPVFDPTYSIRPEDL